MGKFTISGNLQRTYTSKPIKSGVTQKNNEYNIFKDKNGNNIIRIDYNNNDPSHIFDEEEVRTQNGELVSYTTRIHTENNENSWYTKYSYQNGELIKIEETFCDFDNNVLKKVNKPVEEVPSAVGIVLPGVLIGEFGDSELKKIAGDYGFSCGQK